MKQLVSLTLNPRQMAFLLNTHMLGVSLLAGDERGVMEQLVASSVGHAQLTQEDRESFVDTIDTVANIVAEEM